MTSSRSTTFDSARMFDEIIQSSKQIVSPSISWIDVFWMTPIVLVKAMFGIFITAAAKFVAAPP